MAGSTAFRVNYTDVEPQTVDWLMAPIAARTQFRQLVVALVLAEKDADLAQGLDRFGLKLAAITKWTRANRRSAMGPADPSAPPLTPAYGLSRTRANLDGRAMPSYAEFFWRDGWGTILDYHRIGARNRWARSGSLPVRDVIGISPAALNRVRQKLTLWWTAWKQTQQRRAQVVIPTGLDRFTFGIGATRTSVERAIQRRAFTGFRQLKPSGK